MLVVSRFISEDGSYENSLTDCLKMECMQIINIAEINC